MPCTSSADAWEWCGGIHSLPRLSHAHMELCASLKPRAGCLLVLCRNTCMVGLTSHGALVSKKYNIPSHPHSVIGHLFWNFLF